MKDGVIIVTGGSRGIGRATVLELAKRGIATAVIGTAESELSRMTVNEASLYATSRFYECHVENYDEVVNTVNRIIDDFGKIKGLVNNAGITKDNLLLSMDKEDIDSVINVNLCGSIYMIKACIKNFLKNKEGMIVNISSVVGLYGNGGQVNYSAAKAGIIGLTKSIAKEYGRKGIRANAVAPGFIETDMTNGLSEEVKKSMGDSIALRRLGRSSDVAKVIAFLLNEDSAYITGQVIPVDGGMY